MLRFVEHPGSPGTLLPMAAAAAAPVATKVAYFPDPVKVENEEGYPPPAVRALLRAGPDLACETVTVAEILTGCLTTGGFTLLCMPGGFAPNYEQLGVAGNDIIRAFVREGGGFVGLCAGAYYGSSAYLGLLPVRVLDVHRWARGCGQCQLAFTPLAASTLGSLGPASLLTVRYANGPIFQISSGSLDSPGCAAYPLAHYATEFAAESLGGTSSFPPIMAGSPAAVLGYFGLGLVALMSPHMEDGEDERSRTPFCNMFRLCSRDSLYQRWQLEGTDLMALARGGLDGSLGGVKVTAAPQGGATLDAADGPLLNVLASQAGWAGRIREM